MKKSFLYEDLNQYAEMSNLIPKDTGLGAMIWLNIQTGREKHGPRIKVWDKDKMLIPLTIDENPKWIQEPDLPSKVKKDIEKWVILNRAKLLKYWLHGIDMSSDEQYKLRKSLKKIE